MWIQSVKAKVGQRMTQTWGAYLLMYSSTSVMSSMKCSGRQANSGGGGVGSGSWICERLPPLWGLARHIIQVARSLRTKDDVGTGDQGLRKGLI